MILANPSAWLKAYAVKEASATRPYGSVRLM